MKAEADSRSIRAVLSVGAMVIEGRRAAASAGSQIRAIRTG
jgi:hypothetical protein